MPQRRKLIQKNSASARARELHLARNAVHSSTSRQVPLELLQLVLNVFRDTFPAQFDSTLSGLLQEIKQNLYDRNFRDAFGRSDLLEAYAMRWSPSRALAYLHIFCKLPTLSSSILSGFPRNEKGNESWDSSTESDPSPVNSLDRAPNFQQNFDRIHKQSNRIVCIGAGAGAELVALGAFLNHIVGPLRENVQPLSCKADTHAMLEVNAIDIADWSPILRELYSSMTTAPRLSQYASVKAQASNQPLINSVNFKLRCTKSDILKMDSTDLDDAFAGAILVTMMFTLNELYSTSISTTTNLLLSLTMLLSPDALLLVVDSPGSYSTIELGAGSDANASNDRKKYPMSWLLDHTLLTDASTGSPKNGSLERPRWEKLISRDAEWFRLPDELKYPIDLEDMRYQLHLYRRV